ncbi:hypothetical protein BKA82DRAFT_4325498 [Pisolithus tinctorius]|nr:hypothetical protein BKA82DRAFT_4325498 [Pisolithus tinctorius]
MAEYDIWFCNPKVVLEHQLANPDFNGEINYAAKELIAEDPETHGAMFVPVILSSDKTIMSVGTGHNEYYPLYTSLRNVHNNVRQAHHNAVSILAFLAIPKSK